jgi:hypothetical protein
MNMQTAFNPAPFPPLPATAPRVAPALTLAGPQEDLLENLTAIIADMSGRYTPDRQLAAYLVFLTLQANAGPADAASQAQVDAVGASRIGVQARELQAQAALTMVTAMQTGSDAGQAARAFYKSLSAFEENIVFQTANIKRDQNRPPAPLLSVPPRFAGRGTTPRLDPFLLFARTMLGLFVDFPLPDEHAVTRPSAQAESAAA